MKSLQYFQDKMNSLHKEYHALSITGSLSDKGTKLGNKLNNSIKAYTKAKYEALAGNRSIKGA